MQGCTEVIVAENISRLLLALVELGVSSTSAEITCL